MIIISYLFISLFRFTVCVYKEIKHTKIELCVHVSFYVTKPGLVIFYDISLVIPLLRSFDIISRIASLIIHWSFYIPYRAVRSIYPFHASQIAQLRPKEKYHAFNSIDWSLCDVTLVHINLTHNERNIVQNKWNTTFSICNIIVCNKKTQLNLRHFKPQKNETFYLNCQ